MRTIADWTSDYRPTLGAFDEMCAVDGAIRPPWRRLLDNLQAAATTHFHDLRADLDRLLRVHGVTYNVYAEPGGMRRTWELDPLPCVLSVEEWSRLELALRQRATLLERLLQDLYGPCRLIDDGILPVELVYGHPGYLHACHGTIADRPALPVYAVDLSRATDGTWWALEDRTQAPSGAGYALENRLLLSRLLAAAHRESHVVPLAPYFEAQRRWLAALAPNADNPRIVLWTPGPGNETFFEHTFLSSYQGYTLVEGGDLVAQDGRVWLKSLDGLQPVDVIIRRVDQAYCDPLELFPDSLLGVPGLLNAVRLGQVAIANPLGSGVLENSGLLAFLPRIARYLLDEDLKMPSVATWWCGGQSECSHVLANLDKLVIKKIDPRGAVPVFGGSLTRPQREELAARITAHPAGYVGQEQVALSTTPVVTPSGLQPRSMLLRCFSTGGGADGYAILPGGLIRVAPRADSMIVSNQLGGISKDVWVEIGAATEPTPRWPAQMWERLERPAPLSRAGGELSSRVAASLFWLGRHLERADGLARLLREVIVQLLEGDTKDRNGWHPDLLCAISHLTSTYPGFLDPTNQESFAAVQTELQSILFDGLRPGSLRFNLDYLTANAGVVRERLSDDMWRVINELDQELRHGATLENALGALERVIVALAALAGLSSESMPRDRGNPFIEWGRRIERTLQTTTLLRAIFLLADSPDEELFQTLLATNDSLRAYRQRYRSLIQPASCLDLTLRDEGNPRSIIFQLRRLRELAEDLPGQPSRRQGLLALVDEANGMARLADIDTPAASWSEPNFHDALDEVLAQLARLLAEISNRLCEGYFSHSPPLQQTVEMW